VVRSDADTVNVDEPVLWGFRFIADGARDVDGFEGESPAVRLAGVTWADKPTPPENPFMLVSVNVDVPDEPIERERDAGLAATLKSPMFTETLTVRVTVPFVPLTKTL